MYQACKLLFFALQFGVIDPSQACTETPTAEMTALSVASALQSPACINCGSPKLACDLTGKPLPKVILVGEWSHEMPGVESIRELVIDKGRKGQYPVAAEVGEGTALLPFKKIGGSDSLVYGIESPTPYAISATYLQQNDLLMARRPVQEIFERAVMGLHNLPLLHSAYEKMMSSDKFSDMPAVLKPLLIQLGRSFEEVEKDPQQDPMNLFKRKYFDKATDKEKTLFITELHKATVEIANDKYLSYFGGEKLVPYLERVQFGMIFMKAKDTPPGVPKSPFQRVTIDARDRDFAKSITDLMCVYGGRYNKIGVLTGWDHVEGISEFLKQATGSRVQIEQLRADPSNRVEIERALQ